MFNYLRTSRWAQYLRCRPCNRVQARVLAPVAGGGSGYPE